MSHTLRYADPGGQSVPYGGAGCEEQDRYIHWCIMLTLITPWWAHMIFAWLGWLALLGIDAAAIVAICTLIWWVRSRDTDQPKQDHPLDYERLQALYLEQEGYSSTKGEAFSFRPIKWGRLYATLVMIEFHLDDRSGVPPYLQIVQQVKQAMRLGLLNVGDRLPTVREVVERLVINPNTVLKAYRELEHEGLIVSRPGQGTFILRTLTPMSPKSYTVLRHSLVRWLESAREAGLDDESILALFNTTLREARDVESEGTA